MDWKKVLGKAAKGTLVGVAGIGGGALAEALTPAIAAALPPGFPVVVTIGAVTAILNWWKHRNDTK